MNPDSSEAYSVELTEGETLQIGRKPSPGGIKKLILPYPEVSGKHAEIRCKPEGWTIVDSGSTNGTSINGTRCTPGREYHLKNGDKVKIAQYEIFVFPPESDDDEEFELANDDTQDRTQLSIKFMNATILVGDIRSFTTLLERYRSEPERVMHVAQRVFDALNVEINKNYGLLEKSAGDAIMAYWSGDNTKEGSRLPAYQACLTALKLAELTTKLANDRAYWPFEEHPLAIDIALATGPVASGALGQGSNNPSVLGDTANLVFRLEKLIGEDNPGDVIVDGVTFSLANDKCDFQYLGSHDIKGKTKPVDVYRLKGIKGI
ncbi:MAG: adenylate/guanylate cyclase domain-containing protein [Candidatus Obscuribacterales bacterium]|nr:adenylate/guanylate cyclase domain-containing protein [Candidatus Obscuribacterales bacterium]